MTEEEAQGRAAKKALKITTQAERITERMTAGGVGQADGEMGGGSRSKHEREVRRRVAEILSSAGVPSSQIALHSLFLLPPDFLDAYMALFHRALKVDGDNSTQGDKGRVGPDGKMLGSVEKARGIRVSRMSEGKTLGGMSGAKSGGGGKGRGKTWTVADEKALARKERIDKSLRKITREIRKGLDDDLRTEMKGEGGDDEMGVLRCKGRKCGKFMDTEWTFCPSCGTQARTKIERGE